MTGVQTCALPISPQTIARDLVAQVLGSKIPVARPLPEEVSEERGLGSSRLD